MRGGYHPTHQYPTSESGVVFFSSPPDTSLIEPWTPPPFQGINIDDYEAPSSKRDQTSGRLSFTPTMEGTSMAPTREASKTSSARFTEHYDTNLLTEASNNPKEVSKCELCDRLLSQRPIGSYDMPIAAILSCRHVFHAECLEKNTAISHRSDPPCPMCSNVDTENSPEQVSFPSLRNVFPRRRQVFGESSSKKSWGCVRSGDCVEGALHTQKSSNRNRLKKSLFLKGNCSKDFSGKAKKSGTFPLHIFGGKFVDHEVNNGCSKAEA